MRKIVFISIALIVFVLCGPVVAKSTTSVPTIEGDILHTIQSAWIIAESENSAQTQTDALAVTEMTKKLVDALIVADLAQEAYISVLALPSKWNAIRFRAIGISNGGTLTHEIYLGTLGGDLDCTFTYAAQLAWVIGTQQSIYVQIAFTDGGTYEPKAGDIVTGNASAKTAVIISKTLTAGAWADGNAAGTITYRSASGAFTGGETVFIAKANEVLSSDAFTHTGSLVYFELADTLVTTEKSWGSSWITTSPEDNTNAEAQIDKKGADIMVVVTTTCSADGKLLITGY